MRKAIFFGSFLACILALSGCGKANPPEAIQRIVESKPYTIRILVNIYADSDTEIFLKANEVEVDRENMRITVKDGLISNYNKRSTFGIGLAHETIFHFPLGGGEIEIWGPRGLYQKITENTFEEKRGK